MAIIKNAVADNAIALTTSAGEDVLALGYTRPEAFAVLARLTPQHFRETVLSRTKLGTTMDVYAVTDRRRRLYIKFQYDPPSKLVLVSFHEAKYPI